VIQGTKERSEADNAILLRWEAMWLEIRSLFSTATQAKFSSLNQLIREFSNPVGDVAFRMFFIAKALRVARAVPKRTVARYLRCSTRGVSAARHVVDGRFAHRCRL
jgi:hypothetical protein